MPGIEFRIGFNDHHKVEEFLTGNPDGVDAVRIDARCLKRHAEVIDAARRNNVNVYVEPLTERFAAVGFRADTVPYAPLPGSVISRRTLASVADRARFVERVLEHQLDVASALTPPHLFVDNDDSLNLNVGLVRQAAAVVDTEHTIRPILAVSGHYLRRAAIDIATRYIDAGVAKLELRVSPLGGEDQGPLTIQRTVHSLSTLRSAGLRPMLGLSGTIGHATTALGLTDGYSTGVGLGERYNYKDQIANQRRLHQDDGATFGQSARVYIVAANLSLPPRVAAELYQNPAIRAELGCRIGRCAHSLDGPLRDPRGHYLHARAAAVVQLLGLPVAWRTTSARDELVRARDFRQRLLTHLPADANRPKGRTLDSLISEVDRWLARSLSA